MLNRIYIGLMVLVMVAMCAVFNLLPRSKVSELEKRDLTEFPAYSPQRLANGSFTSDVSAWYSDTEPYRDQLMMVSMYVKDIIRLNVGEANVTFHASKEPEVDAVAEQTGEVSLPEDYENHLTADENAKIANAGIIIVGSGENVRALMAYGGGAQGGLSFARAVNLYKERFPAARVYCMVIPIATDYYIPDKVKKRSQPQHPTIENIYAHLTGGVKPVDIYNVMGQHADEDIYLRTDHHWAPLGAYYAAKEFARVAGVAFRDLASYDRHVIRGYVGSMYGYSNDIAVKNAPEDFVYYTPRGIDYTTSYITYKLDKDFRIVSESGPTAGQYFHKFKDGSSNAYCTFMGGDSKITVVRTAVKNHRRLMIIKDSFGNALPGYMFYSFEEIHVIDFRYFAKNMVDYVNANHITDILFACNIYNAYSLRAYDRYERFLNQSGTIVPPPPVAEKKKGVPAEVPTAQPVENSSVNEAVEPVQADTTGH